MQLAELAGLDDLDTLLESDFTDAELGSLFGKIFKRVGKIAKGVGKVAKGVGKVALPIVKLVPGVGNAVSAAETGLNLATGIAGKLKKHHHDIDAVMSLTAPQGRTKKRKKRVHHAVVTQDDSRREFVPKKSHRTVSVAAAPAVSVAAAPAVVQAAVRASQDAAEASPHEAVQVERKSAVIAEPQIAASAPPQPAVVVQAAPLDIAKIVHAFSGAVSPQLNAIAGLLQAQNIQAKAQAEHRQRQRDAEFKTAVLGRLAAMQTKTG